MWHRLFVISTCVLSVYTIIVPIENNQEDSTTESTTVTNSNDTNEGPKYYIPEDAQVDSYLIPPDPHKPQEVLPDSVVTPATYLLPPSADPETRFYYPATEAGQQTDWYPIAQVLPPENYAILSPAKLQKFPIPFISNGPQKVQNTRLGKAYAGERYTLGKPSIRLEPPPIDATNDYILPTSEQLETPYNQPNQPNQNSHKLPYIDINEKVSYPNTFLPNNRIKSEDTGLVLHLTPPKPSINQHKYPTNLYPKKYSGGFKPVPIPIAQFVEDPQSIPRAKPVQHFKPLSNVETDYIPSPEDKKTYLYKVAEQKRKLKAEEDAQLQPLETIGLLEDFEGVPTPTEQDTSETNNRYPGHNVYPDPVRQPTRPAPQRVPKSPAAPNERTEFRMHGMKGPHSYQFGYDTGKGKNRQFRYEERDNDGQIRGHYGYMDKHGKLRVVNYSAHPELGFHAEPPVEKE